ncbi:hemoglobin/transferrin/lactoferrin receptor protein [Sulfitobacter undariae]|uniref:Hemoglobin/transferrin/lactoferrin receptor protein n=1 Tax=Sulfitobacter undariae TaxID=1563671 RepID=A0A7W6E4J0_9RHOB|nr:TonB-dependent hemoglobin/transferrin/lactoferrin family receptor [Sulfitobacter undariae]MBB3994611.1 hemoglobin/transferrin/lactoferrin receptor protein [Sulfitobacter undariae]
MTFRCRIAALSSTVAIAALLPYGALAQDVADDENLLGTIVLSTDRQGDQVLDVPANITVIDSAEIEARNITDMQELTRYTPGVSVFRQTNSTDPFNTFSGFTIRGVSANRVQMQVDGSRVPERIIDGTRDYIDFSFTKQVEIVRGPASVLWGADALGGIVALETLDPEDVLDGRERGGSVRTAYDSSNDGADVELTFGQKLLPNLELLIGLSRETTSETELSNARDDGGAWGCPRNVDYGASTCGELDPTSVTSNRGLAKLVWTPTDNHRLEFTLDALERTTTVDHRVTRGPVVSSFTGLPTGEIINSYDRELEISRQRYAVEHEWALGGGIFDSVKSTLAFTPNSYSRTGAEFSTSAAGDSIMSYDNLDYSEEFFEIDVQANGSFITGNLRHDFVLGIDADRTKTDYERIDRTNNLTTGINTETRAGGFNFANATTTRADIYIQDKITFGGNRFELTSGLRYATYSLDPRPNADYQVVTGSEPIKRSDQKLLKSLGATYHFNDTYSVWAKYGEGFKMPTSQQLFTSLPGSFFNLTPAPDLKPEEVKNIELGVRGQFGRGFFSVNAFKADYTNFIQSFYNPPGTSDYTYRNLSSVDIWGIEASGSWEIKDDLNANFSAAYQKATQRVNSGSAETPHNVAPLTATIGLAYDMPQYDLQLEAIGTFSAGVEDTDKSTAFKPAGYGILDLYATWTPNKVGKFTVGVQNVFDRRYFPASAASYGATATNSVAAGSPLELQTGLGRTIQVSYQMEF